MEHMIQKSNITIVIPVHGNINYTIGCLQSLYAKSSPLVDEIIVIDNHPDKDTTREILQNWKNVSVYCPQSNLGVSVSWDAGIKIAKNNIVAVINNDIEVLTDNWDELLLEEWMKYPEAAVFCPWPVGSIAEYLNPENQPLDGLNGSFFLVDRQRLQLTDNYKLLGQYIDHQFARAYWEDCDLLTQVRKAGMQVLVTPKIPILHYGNKTAGPMLPSHKGMDNPYWANLDRFNKKYNVYIWDYFKVFMSNVLHETTGERLI